MPTERANTTVYPAQTTCSEHSVSPYLIILVVSPLSKSSLHHKAPPPSEHLPSLTNMHAVAMVSVDTDSERLKVQRFIGRGGNTKKNQDMLKAGPVQRIEGSPNTIQRSKSLMNIK